MPDSVIDVCLIDSDRKRRERLSHRLLAEHVSVLEVVDCAVAAQHLHRDHPRVLIAAVAQNPAHFLSFCREMRTSTTLDCIYIIVLTADPSRATRHALLEAGVDDILVDPDDEVELLARLRNGLRTSQLHERLHRAALTDGLTSLWNHGQFRTILTQEFARTRRYGGCVSLIMLDLDHFKAVNDTYGHEIGNEVLQATALHLRRMVRDTDTVARYGGEEFAIVCPQTELKDAVVLADRIRKTLPRRASVPECPHLHVTATFGVASSEDPEVGSVTELINQADQALYYGKSQGRNRVTRCDRMPERPVRPEMQADEIDRLRKQVLALSLQSKQLCLQSVYSLVQALEARDRFTAWQSRNVTFYMQALVKAAHWPENLRRAATNAAMLHNLGKIGIPDRILQKPGALTSEEAAVLRQVPQITCKILEPLRIFETETLIIRHVRERFDGSGYPHGLEGTTIPLGSRMLAITEAFDAMTSDRAYRSRLSMDQAFQEIQRQAGRQFDPEFAALLGEVLELNRQKWQARMDRTLREGQASSLLVS